MSESEHLKTKSAKVSERMRRVRSRDTASEVSLRSELHRLGLRYRLNARATPCSQARPDILFSKSLIAVFVDGCFWHACPEHASWPKTNAEWWRRKISANVERDRRHDRELTEAGWTVIRIWEHESPLVSAKRILSTVRERSITIEK